MSDKLTRFVSVNRQFLRSVNLTADYGRADALQGYVLQPSAHAALETIAGHLSSTQQRAFTWTGPYGGGKSSLALALASLAGGDALVRKAALKALGLTAKDCIVREFGANTPWTVLNIVGKRVSVIEEISNAIDTGIKGQRGRKPQLNGQRDVIAELVRFAESNQTGGLLLIIDELGKLLEHAAQSGEDVGFYQDLAEAASRCKGNFVVLGVLHQSFEQYALRLGQDVQQEWAKVQGRYVDIPLVAGSDEVVALISRALTVTLPHPNSIKTADQVATVIRQRRPSAVSDVNLLLDAAWPLHPVTASLLGPASRKRFGQNERSVFSFLASAEPLSFSEILKGLDASADSYYYPAQFWDYLKVNFEPAILSSSDGHRWASCVDAIERTEARFSSLHVKLVKTISLIELFRDGSGLSAEQDLLRCCVDIENYKLVDQALAELTSASILIFRKHLTAFGIYAGSDFDIEQALRNAKSQISTSLISTIASFSDLGPITARRHYWATGAMRWLSRAIVSSSEAVKYIEKIKVDGSFCGGFLLVLDSSYGDQQRSNKIIKQLSEASHHKGLLIARPKNAGRLGELILNVSALEYVRANSRELHGDSVATTEVNSRIRSSRSSLEDELRDSFQHAAWLFNGKAISTLIGKNSSLSQIASYVADSIYSQSPHVYSELVNRNEISSSASKALRDLLHRMLSSGHESSLGYTSYPADAGLYYTVIQSTGLHRKTKDGWKFTDPKSSDHGEFLRPAWERAKELILQTESITRLDQLYEIWGRPPYGIKSGLLPIFALAFFLSYRHQLALYIEGTFIPDLTDAYLDEWLQDPSRIGWRFVKIEGSERKMLQLLSTALSARLNKKIAADALDSARAIVALIFQLPAWTRRTEMLSPKAKDVRRLLLHASDPHKVLFADLPLILGTTDPEELAEKIASLTGELTDAYAKRLRRVEERVLESLDFADSLPILNDRGLSVASFGADFKLDAFATRLSTYSSSIQDLEGMLMLAIGKPTRDWTDHDINSGEIQLVSWAFEFRRLESLVKMQDRPAARRAIGIIFGTDETVSGTFDVASSDTFAIDSLADEFVKKLSGGIKREVLLAAIAQAGATIFKQLEQEKGTTHD